MVVTAAAAEVGGGEVSYYFMPASINDEFILFMSDTLEVTAVSQDTKSMLGVRMRTSCTMVSHLLTSARMLVGLTCSFRSRPLLRRAVQCGLYGTLCRFRQGLDLYCGHGARPTSIRATHVDR